MPVQMQIKHDQQSKERENTYLGGSGTEVSCRTGELGLVTDRNGDLFGGLLGIFSGGESMTRDVLTSKGSEVASDDGALADTEGGCSAGDSKLRIGSPDGLGDAFIRWRRL